MDYTYKFENFKYTDFPVFSSTQSGSGAIVIPHIHSAMELLLVLHGQCTVRIDTSVLYCCAGDVIFIPPHCVHTVIGAAGNTCIKGITVDPTLLDKTGELSLEKTLGKQNVTTYSVEWNADELRNAILNFSLDGEDRSPLFRVRILAQLYHMIGVLLNNYPMKPPAMENGRLAPVLRYIHDHYALNIRISDLSAIVNVCDDHFIRLFKQVTNRTPICYINDLRIEHTLRLLADSDLSISEISDAVGFSDVNHMIRLFKRAMHITPLAYRRAKVR